MTRSAERRLAVPVQGDPRSPTEPEAAGASELLDPADMSDASESAGASERAEPTEPTESAEPRPTIARLADELLPMLIARLEASSLGEIEIGRDGWRVRLRRSTGEMPGTAQVSQAGRHGERRSGVLTDAGAEGAGSAGSGSGAPDGRGGRAERERTVITAPAVGYYLPREALQVGQSFRGGDLIGHVDVLGVLQDVVVPVDGRLGRLLAESGEAVEYGQPLARFEPESRS